MNHSNLEKELRIKYGQHRKSLSDPFELLDLVVDHRKLKSSDRKKAIELAEEIYFNYNTELYEYQKDR